MKFTIHTTDLKELLFEFETVPDFKNGIYEIHETIEADFLVGKHDLIEMEDMMINNFYGKWKTSTELIGRHEESLVELQFFLKGEGQSKIHGLEQPVKIRQGEYQLIYSPEKEERYLIKKDEMIHGFSLDFNVDHFLRIADGLVGPINQFAEKVRKNELAFLGTQSFIITPKMLGIIYDMIECQMPDNIKVVYLHNKSEELLILLASQWLERQSQAKFSFSNSDRDKFYQVKSYLDECPNDLPGLKELAIQFGLNEFKLKKGFKELFKTTVFGHLLDVKLEKARKLLLETSLGINEIGVIVGYKYPQHFTTAFKKKFGYPPNRLRIQRMAVK